MRYLGRVPPQRSGVRSPGLAEWGGLVGVVPCSPHPLEGEYSTSPAGHWYPPTTVSQSISQSVNQSINQSISQSFSHSISQSVSQTSVCCN